MNQRSLAPSDIVRDVERLGDDRADVGVRRRSGDRVWGPAADVGVGPTGLRAFARAVESGVIKVLLTD